MAFRVVDDYYRQRHFDFYSGYRSPFYSMTVELDVTELKSFAEKRGYSTYANLCYFFTRAARGIEDFRYRLRDGAIVLYDELHLGMTVPAPRGLFSFAYVDFDPDIERFNRAAAARIEAAGREATLREEEHDNYVYFTALPRVPFTAFTHASESSTDVAPRVAFGGFRRAGGRLLCPVGVQVNHLFIDGTALGELCERVREGYARPERESAAPAEAADAGDRPRAGCDDAADSGRSQGSRE